jgi:hypothetical protein
MSDVDPILKVIERYRTAARRIVARRGPLVGPTGKYVAIVRLGELVAAEPDPVIRAWATEGVWRDLRDLLGWVPELDKEPRLPYAERIRLMVIAGYRTCPCCGRPMDPALIREREAS